VQRLFRKLLFSILAALLFVSCSKEAEVRRALRSIGAEQLRAQVLKVCHDEFSSGASRKIPEDKWPDAVRSFHPLGLWAEPDGAYLLTDSDADGERGIYFPRVLSEKDPLCSPVLKHVKLAEGVYWYEKKRS
jgi:hypothetical protein